MNTLTVPKIKDLVHKPSEQYKDIFDTMHKGMEKKVTSNLNKTAPEDSSAMTDELTQFFNDLKKTSTLANSTLNTNDNNSSDPLGEPLISSSNISSNTTYSPY